MQKFYWSRKTWGENPLPENWQVIAEAAKREIDGYISENELDRYTDFEQIKAFSDLLAENWLTLDELPEDLKTCK